jgi:hypothetical protein
MKRIYYLLMALAVLPLAATGRQEVVNIVVLTSLQLQIDPILGLAIAANESDLHPRATSPERTDGSCDRGLFQLNSNYSDEFFSLYLPGQIPDPYDPWKSAYVGLSHFKALVRQLGSIEAGLIGYNMGAQRYLSKKGSLIPAKHPYVRAVRARYQEIMAKTELGIYRWNSQLNRPLLSPSLSSALRTMAGFITMPQWYYQPLLEEDLLCGRDITWTYWARERLTWLRRRRRAIRVGLCISKTPPAPIPVRPSLKLRSETS